MKYTLLELVQNVLSSMDSDEVNSITDTTESQQVVEVIKTVYDDIMSRSDVPIQKTLFTLDASGSASKPVLMTKPATIDSIIWIKYNKVIFGDTDPAWTDIKYMPVDEFMDYTHVLAPSATDVDTFAHTVSGFTFSFYYKNNTGPTYYTSFNDNTIIFDAFDKTVDSTLQSSKTLCYGELSNTFVESDSFTPNLQPQQFALLLNEAKSLAWAELKQTVHQKAEQTARRNWRHLARTRRHTPTSSMGRDHPLNYLPDFGRRV